MNSNILIKCISNNNFTAIDIESNSLKLPYEHKIKYLKRIICKKKNDYYVDLNEFSDNIIKKNKVTAIVEFSNINEYFKFSNGIQFIKCHYNEENQYNIMNMYNYITSNIENIKYYQINDLNKCFEDSNFQKREDEQTENNNSFVIYFILILVLVVLIIGTIVFAVIHRKQDKKKEQKEIENNKVNKNEKSKDEEKSVKDKNKLETEMSNSSLDNEQDITEKGESSNFNLMKNALNENDQTKINNDDPLNLSNDYYYKDYCQKSPILYNNKKNNITFDYKNMNNNNKNNLLPMSNRPHSKQNRISVNPNCLPEIKIRPESLMLEEELAKEVSRIFKNYDESFRYSKTSFKSFDPSPSHRINKSQTKDLESSSKRSSKNLQLNRLSKNIKRKKGKNAVQKRISNNRSLIILPIESELSSNRNSLLDNKRISFIQKGTYSHSKSEYYFDHNTESPDSELSSEISQVSPFSNSNSTDSPISATLTTPTDGNISIDISNMNVRSKNRMSKNAVKTKSSIYQIQQMPHTIQYNEASRYDSINIMIENADDSTADECSVVIQVNENEDNNNNTKSELNNNKNENSTNDENKDLNINNENSKLMIVTKQNNNKEKLKKEVSSSSSVTYDVCESVFEESENEKDENVKCLMSPVCESDHISDNKIEIIDKLHLNQDEISIKKRNSGQFSVNLECKEDEEKYEKSSNNSSNCDLHQENTNTEMIQNKRNTFGFFDINSKDALRTLNENINKRMTLSNQKDSQDMNN
ncbi:hypothetical protein LY90DRAFT_668916 [Neocallimastix californiae]|uniref:Uncharacterized protein n=1 Tax=Neocallimastix californiae TaxID=1754190 RepID=A0A1Y2DI91_9FUNG|nr:hypothetical protein LY90DRAFT_668916 [Neocallimastix californiae]|eukprot:ORY58951.1 hypothetical protein LY90DRAFT_668916 [Neocallimastix californiae]